jgi:hypothetical protein
MSQLNQASRNELIEQFIVHDMANVDAAIQVDHQSLFAQVSPAIDQRE